MLRSPRLPFTRALALFLCAQPVLWMSNVALAQTLDQQAGGAAGRAAACGRGSRSSRCRASRSSHGPAGAGQPGLRAARRRAHSPQGRRAPRRPSRPRRARRRAPAPTARPPRPARATPVDEPLDPDRYVLGSGRRAGAPLLGRRELPVPRDGRPGGARLRAQGRLPRRCAGRRSPRRRACWRRPWPASIPKLGFGVNLAEPRTFLVQVVDDVVRPGRSRPRPSTAWPR